MDINKRLAILGSTGSIGRQTLEVVDEYPQQFEVYLITANNNIDLLIEQARKYRPEIAIIANKEHYATLRDALVKEIQASVPQEMLAPLPTLQVV